MGKISVLMIGIGGYGEIYLDELLNSKRAKRFVLVGAVDPYADKSIMKPKLLERGVPIYDTVEEFYKEHTAQLAIVSTPIHLHARQIIYCMEHCSDVLCEKPMCPSMSDAAKIIETRDLNGRKLGIGFQWTFAKAILKLKEDIANGVYGDIKRVRSIVYFPRDLEYYSRGSGWAGKRYLKSGELLLDSIANNAASHYLHNMLFLTGPQVNLSAEPAKITAEIYRANQIEMFDTCVLRVITNNNIELLFYATHAVPKEQARDAEFIIEGEKGTVTLSYDDNNNEILTGVLKDGSRIEYEAPSKDLLYKLYCMADAIEGNNIIPCTPETVLPHLKCIRALAEMYPETPEFPPEFVEFRTDTKQFICVGLAEALEFCWKNATLPNEEHMPWSLSAKSITL